LRLFRAPFIGLVLAVALLAHPMGNFSVNHYARFEVQKDTVDLTYAIDLAEIPTFDLLRSWGLERTSPPAMLNAKAREQAQGWLKQLQVTSGQRPVRVEFLSSDLVIADGAGNLPIARITTKARIVGAHEDLAYEDMNFSERAGWKEIVIVAGRDVRLKQASQSGQDVTDGLKHYPPDPTIAPPQDLRAQFTWTVETLPVISQAAPPAARPVAPPEVKIAPIPQPKKAPGAVAPSTLTTAAPPGSVVRGDWLSRLLHRRELTPWMIVLGILAAFVLGGAHALTPGHGKTIVAAYLVGSRGTLRHAAFLGAMVTFTHTISVFALGIATLFLFRFIVPEKITQWLGVVSGLSIVVVGLWMAYKRLRHAGHHHHHHVHSHHEHSHAHDHSHAHPHEHAHDHDHVHAHVHDHDHAHLHEHSHSHGHEHHHGPGGHTHMPEDLSWAGLVALGASGGLVPCESALVLLLGAIALGRVAFGLLLLVAFSAGLAGVLMAIGGMVLYARRFLPDMSRSRFSPFMRYMPVASAVIVTVVGVMMTAVSLGWVNSRWTIG
jgi:nickel/cobalt transporter (NicO) family protein